MPRDGTKNLVPTSKRSKEEVKKIGRKGGIASGKARAEKKQVKEALQLLFDMEHTVTDKRTGKTEKLDGMQMLAKTLFKGAAVNGEIAKIELALKIIGQHPANEITHIIQDGEKDDLTKALESIADKLDKGE